MGRLKTLSIAGAVTALYIAIMNIGAYGGDYHYGNTLKCPDCHASHTGSRSAEQNLQARWEQPAFKRLLIAASPTQTCLKCHDNQPGIPDVVGADVNNPYEQYDGSERAGGRFSSGGDNWKGHDLSGEGGDSQLECVSCHDPHGNSNYRNLKTFDGSEDGPVAFVNSTAAGLDKYRRWNIGYGRNMGDKLCGGCHDFGSPRNTLATGGTGHYHRHPSSSAELITTVGEADMHTDPKHWATGSGSGFISSGQTIPRVPFAMSSAIDYSTAKMVSSDNEVFCLSCHKAHGSVHAFGMVWPYGTGDGALSGAGCNQCHNTARM